MAGSPGISSSFPFADPILSARVDALRLLADRVSDRVMVIDRGRTIVYANEQAWRGDEHRLYRERPAKCYEAFLNQADPCGSCPATEVFRLGEVRSVSCSGEMDAGRCGMRHAIPLMSSQGTVDSVLVLLGNESRSPSGDTAPLHHPESRPPAVGGDARLGELIGQSASMRQLFEMIYLIADSQATVLLQGESGTGKELAARTIHSLSSRRTRPFVVVDCGALPETLLETELFGHVKGAFTGAVASKKGLFEEADGGTLFLDEIGDTSLSFQSKLLRVLQEGEVKPVGSSRAMKVDVRVISATNKDLLERVKTRRFREDLYYRLSVLPLYLPPLRDRREDIPLLIGHFVALSSQRNGKPVRPVTPDAVATLAEATWPGNIRELQHLIERAVVTTPGLVLTREDFFQSLRAKDIPFDLRVATREATRNAERMKIRQALQKAAGNRAKAARILNISRASLYNKLRAYELG